MKRSFDSDSERHSSSSSYPNANANAHSLPPQSNMAPSYSSRGNGRGNGSARNSNSNNKRARTSQAGPSHSSQIIPQASPPLYDQAYVESSWRSHGGRGEPNRKWIENPKGVIANYIVALGEHAKYDSKRVRVGNWEGFR